MKKIFTIIIILLLTCLLFHFMTWRIEQIENNPQAFGENGKCQRIEIFKK